MDDRKSSSSFDWDDARIFLAAYRSGSLLGAAQALGVSHSTVRRRLAGLEQRIATKLFEATSEGLVPTDAAEVAFVAAERIETAALAFGAQLGGEARDIVGNLVVTTVDGLAAFVAPIIANYQRANPEVALTLNTENRMVDLLRREADVALRLSNNPDERLFGRRVGTVSYAPFAARRLVKRHGTEIDKLPWILWDEAAGAVETERWYAQRAKGRPPIARITNAVALLALAEAGIGGALLPLPMAQQTKLVQIGEPVKGFDTALWCLCNYDLRHSERIRRFMEQVVEHGVVV